MELTEKAWLGPILVILYIAILTNPNPVVVAFFSFLLVILLPLYLLYTARFYKLKWVHPNFVTIKFISVLVVVIFLQIIRVLVLNGMPVSVDNKKTITNIIYLALAINIMEAIALQITNSTYIPEDALNLILGGLVVMTLIKSYQLQNVVQIDSLGKNPIETGLSMDFIFVYTVWNTIFVYNSEFKEQNSRVIIVSSLILPLVMVGFGYDWFVTRSLGILGTIMFLSFENSLS